MNTGKTLFAQLMDFLPWTTFTRIVDRYGGDHRVRTLSCAEQYRSMAFAQLTYRESLRDIETCLSVHASKLYHMGFRQPVRRSTLADANERRDWRIHAALAQRLITQARTLYVDEELGLDLTNTVYALDSTTIALCLSVFPWAHFRTTKAAVKMHTLLDLRGNIPSFIHISDGKLHDVCPRYGSRSHLPWIVATSTLPAMCCTKPGLRHAGQVEHRCSSRLFGSLDRHHLRTISLDGFYTRQDYPEASASRTPSPARRWSSSPTTSRFRPPPSARSTKAAGRWNSSSSGSSASSDQAVLRHVGERGEDADLDCRLGLRPRRHRQEAPRPGRPLYTLLQILSVTLFEKMPIHQALAGDENRCNASQITNQLNLIVNRTLVVPII